MTNHNTTETPDPLEDLIVPDGWEAELIEIGWAESCYIELTQSTERNNSMLLPCADSPTAAVAAANEVLIALAKSVLAKVE